MFVDIMNIKKSGQQQWGKNLLRNGNATKSKVSLCYCSKEGRYHSWSFTMQDFKDLPITFLIRGGKF